ncbi:helix-turn-helix transcriptional regulator [Kitasatospora kazusensis]
MGTRVRHLRTVRGLSQADLAGPELSASYISLIEAGKRTPSRRALKLIAARLGCAPSELYDAAVKEADSSADLALAEAEWALADGKPATALERFGEAATLAVAASSPECAVRAAWGEARSLEAMARLDEALDAYTDLLEGLQPAAVGPPTRLEAIRAVCRCEVELGQIDRAIEIGESALRELDESGSAPSAAGIEIMCELVRAYLLRGDVLRAGRLTEAAVAQAELLRSPHQLARAYRAAGQAAQEAGRPTEAGALARKALELLRQGDGEAVLGDALALHGMTVLRAGRTSLLEAERDLRRAAEIQERTGQLIKTAECYQELAHCSLIRGDGEAAMELAARALSLLEEAPVAGRARAIILTATALAMCGRTTEALERCDEAVAELGEDTRGLLPTARIWGEAAEVYMALGATEKAVSTWRRGFSLLGPTGPLPGLLTSRMDGSGTSD